MKKLQRPKNLPREEPKVQVEAWRKSWHHIYSFPTGPSTLGRPRHGTGTHIPCPCLARPVSVPVPGPGIWPMGQHAARHDFWLGPLTARGWIRVVGSEPWLHLSRPPIRVGNGCYISRPNRPLSPNLTLISFQSPPHPPAAAGQESPRPRRRLRRASVVEKTKGVQQWQGGGRRRIHAVPTPSSRPPAAMKALVWFWIIDETLSTNLYTKCV